jgi:uncharacterized protein (TIGR03083 family)
MSTTLREPAPLLEYASLFAPLHGRLLEVLGPLDDAGWRRPTRAGAWRVRDVAAHLLDNDLRALSYRRDRMVPPPPDTPIDGFQPLVGFLARLNQGWVDVFTRFSPRVLLDLLAWSGPQVSGVMAALDPFADALFPVAWAGEERSQNWMDVAREYTERWHHQQQIREAVGAKLLEEVRFLRPLLHVSVRALPRAWADTEAPPGTAVAVHIEGESGGDWTLRRHEGGWALLEGAADAPAARVSIGERVAWRIFFKALSDGERRAGITASGDARLAAPMATTLAVMA